MMTPAEVNNKSCSFFRSKINNILRNYNVTIDCCYVNQ